MPSLLATGCALLAGLGLGPVAALLLATEPLWPGRAPRCADVAHRRRDCSSSPGSKEPGRPRRPVGGRSPLRLSGGTVPAADPCASPAGAAKLYPTLPRYRRAFDSSLALWNDDLENARTRSRRSKLRRLRRHSGCQAAAPADARDGSEGASARETSCANAEARVTGPAGRAELPAAGPYRRRRTALSLLPPLVAIGVVALVTAPHDPRRSSLGIWIGASGVARDRSQPGCGGAVVDHDRAAARPASTSFWVYLARRADRAPSASRSSASSPALIGVGRRGQPGRRACAGSWIASCTLCCATVRSTGFGVSYVRSWAARSSSTTTRTA